MDVILYKRLIIEVISITSFINNIIYNFLISFGVILGASVFAGVAAIINNHPPFKTMIDLAASIKVWAIAIALGGTFSSFEVLDKGIIKGEVRSLVKQIIYILVALIGANLGYNVIKLFQRCGQSWIE
jgi:hypothetical protein